MKKKKKQHKKQKSDLIEVHEIPKGESYTANAEINEASGMMVGTMLAL